MRLTEGERGRLSQTPTGNPEAYDLVLQGRHVLRRTTRDSNAEARQLFVKALDLDPDFAGAAAGLGWAHLQSWQLLWTTDPASLERARALARRAVALDETRADAHRLLAQIDLWSKTHDTAIAHAERSLALAPGDAEGYETLAEVLGWAGQPDESARLVRQAMRLNPHYPFSHLWTLGHAHFVAGRRRDAVEAFSRLVEQNPNFLPAHAYLAVLFSEMGRPDQARVEWETTTRLSPEASLAVLRQRLPYRRPADLDRFLAAMRKQGLE